MEKKERQFYDVRTEVITPIDVTYKVFASSPEEAMDMVLKGKVSPRSVGKPKRLNAKRIAVFIVGTVSKLLEKQLF